ncbi:sucrase ferredoxin [Jatrophihabitans fulvus]
MSGARPRPRETPDRCALRSQLRGDPMLGTAFPAARVLLIEQPGPWGRRGLQDSHFDHEVATPLIARANRAGVRVQAIRRHGRTETHRHRAWILADTRPGHESLRWGLYERDADLLELPLDGSVGTEADGVLYLVCAHGKHDPCCALRGRTVAKALDELRPDRVWETTHLGGDRFAANVLVLPTGLLYGRVLPMAAPEFVAAAEAGEVVGALLRGRVGLPPAAQAALAFGFEHLAVRRVDELAVVSHKRADDGSVTVRLRGPHGLLDVRVNVEQTAVSGLTCVNPRPGTFLTYRPVAIEPVL